MRVTDAAERLGVSVSTAHRLLTALVHRGFAEQLADRRYGPGGLLSRSPASRDAVARLREAALPHMRRLVDRWGETANLTILVGVMVRFVATVEGGRVLRVGDRTGRTLPAHLSSGGKAMLAMLSPEELEPVLDDLDGEARARLHRELRAVRRRGHAVNDQQTETGLTAVGVALPRVAGMPLASVALAMPTARYSRNSLPVWSADLAAAAGAIARDLTP
ncbi:MAG: IclR family transcriptional regulator, acetate operon repressor [Acidimicrobiia bacterium]|nr:IclR family transcriptional regulator, acetate operon repressor [Acidimicrobiia bacterium]